MTEINVLSTFNGMGCIWYALDRAGIKVNKRYSSEIDKFANQSNDAAYPDTIHLGSVVYLTRGYCWRNEIFNKALSSEYISSKTKRRLKKFRALRTVKIDLYVGGSPCQGFSFAGKQLNFNDPRSKLFFDFIRLWNHIKELNPGAKFLLENVNMKKEYMKVINDHLGIMPVRINSNLQSAQNRDRWYWSNIKTRPDGLFGDLATDIPHPKDKGILLKDVLQPESEVDEKYYLSSKLINGLFKHANNRNQNFQTHSPNGKVKCITVSHHKQNLDSNYVCVSMVGRRVGEDGKRKDNDKNIPAIQRLEPVSDPNKTNCLTSVSKDNLLTDGYKLRRLTPRECGRLQTFTEKELDVLLNCGVSDSQLYKQFGNGWTIEPVAHILSFLNK